MTRRATPAAAPAAELGESPRWDAATGTLMWVDIRGGAIHRTDPATGDTRTVAAGPPVTFALPAGDGRRAVCGIGLTIAVVELEDAGADPVVVAALPAPFPRFRLNDAACDPAGRLWAGTMDEDREPGTAALYRLDGDNSAGAAELTPVVTGTTISNGLDWSPDGERLYFADTPSERVDVFDYDVATGEPSARRTFVDLAGTGGRPDGLCVDAEGGVWIALVRIGEVHRYDAAGTLSERLALPVSFPTAPAFGGPGLDTLFVTTAWEQLDAAGREREPDAGRLFAVAQPGVSGIPGRPVSPRLGRP